MKNLKKLWAALLPLLFTSCIWIPTEDYTVLEKKTTCQDFSTVNQPELICMPVRLEYQLLTNKNVDKHPIYGNIYLIYDWENETLFDSIYAPGRNIMSNTVLLPSFENSGVKSFIGYDQEYKALYTIKAGDTKLTAKELTVPMTYDSMFSTGGKTQSKYALNIRQKSYDPSSPERVVANIYNSESATFGSDIKLNVKYRSDIEKIIQDDENNFYYFCQKKAAGSEDTYMELCRINAETGTVTENLKSFNENNGNYKVMYVDDSYIYVNRSYNTSGSEKFFYQLIKLNKSTLEEIASTQYAQFNFWYAPRFVKTSAGLYITFTNTLSSGLTIFKVNSEGTNLSATKYEVQTDINRYDDLFVRENSIYFIYHHDESSSPENNCIEVQKVTFAAGQPVPVNNIVIHQSDLIGSN